MEKNKCVVLTGITGFLGSYLAKSLLSKGYKVIGLKRSSSSLRRISEINENLILVDIDSSEFDFNIFFDKYLDIDCIIHTATCYGRNNESISEIFQANAVFPLELLDSGSRAGVKTFINTDTILDKYLNLYSLSKNQLLQWGVLLSNKNKTKFINVKLEHIFGPDDDEHKFTTHIINSCLDGTVSIDLTYGEQLRDFIYIDDVVDAYLLLIESHTNISNNFFEVEIGSGIPISIKDFVIMVKNLTNSNVILNFGAIPYRDGEVMLSQANINEIKKLNWSCKYSIKEALLKTIKIEGE